jgi:hypothetical protein
MTPFRNDEQNPFSRDSVWPKLPQTPLSVSPGRATPSRYAPTRPAPPDIDFGPMVLSRPRPGQRHSRPLRRRLRLRPLIAAAAVGVGGLLTLFLVNGTGPRP